jgi:hypothetical protein
MLRDRCGTMSRGVTHLAMMLILHSATGMENLVTEHGLSIQVYYSATNNATEGVPLVVYLHGTEIDPSWGGMDALSDEVVNRGFAFAILEWPYWDGSDAYQEDGTTPIDGYGLDHYCNATVDKAPKLFGHAEDTSLSVLCALEDIDCSKGVGVAGYSQGAAIGSMAAKLDDRVTGFFGIALNTVYNFPPEGGREATCHRDATLPASARRYLHSSWV